MTGSRGRCSSLLLLLLALSSSAWCTSVSKPEYKDSPAPSQETQLQRMRELYSELKMIYVELTKNYEKLKASSLERENGLNILKADLERQTEELSSLQSSLSTLQQYSTSLLRQREDTEATLSMVRASLAEARLSLTSLRRSSIVSTIAWSSAAFVVGLIIGLIL